MRVENLVQWIVTATIWSGIMLLLLVLSIVSMLASVWTMPMWVIPLLFALGVVGTTFVFTTNRFQHLNAQIVEQLHELDDDELQEVIEGLAELREKTGLSVELPIKMKNKPKRDAVDDAIGNLSNDELVQLREQLRSGDIDEARLQRLLYGDLTAKEETR